MMLPEPDRAFRWSTEPWGHALRCPALERVAQHLFTTKQLELRRTDVQQLGWAQATASLGAGVDQLRIVKQVHGRSVRILRRGEVAPSDMQERPRADAIVSNVGDLVLAVQVADCVPILMADSRSSAAAAVHAGWRGTCAGVATAAIEAMTREFGTRPEDLTVALGPSIGRCCYRVGPEIVDAFRATSTSSDQIARWFSTNDEGAIVLDLWEANRDQIVHAGVPPERIHCSGLCTQTYAHIFASYRAAGDRAGRMVGIIRTPNFIG